MIIDLFDMKRIIKEKKIDLEIAFSKSLDESSFIFGKDISIFEDKFSKKVESEYCVSVSSGTDALLAIFMALDLMPGDEVIVPSFTFIASVSAIIRAGLKPIFVDLEPFKFCPSIDDILKVWTSKTKCVLFVHLFGEFNDLTELSKICKDRGVILIEDCAQSYGTKVGNFGAASAFSFFPAKNLGCLGDGGAVTTNNKDFFDKIKMIRFHGSKIKYNYEIIGGNFRMDTIQAAFLNILIEESDCWIKKRKENALFYSENFKNNDDFVFPKYSEEHSFNQYTIICKKRDKFKEFLDFNGIGNAIYYPIPIHKSLLFKDSNALPETEKRCNEVISIPIYPGLKNFEREYIVDKILEFLK